MSFSIQRVTSLVTFAVAALSSFGAAEQVQHPLRLQINSDVVKTLFHKGDQRILDAFTDLKLTKEVPGDECPTLGESIFSLTVNEGIDVDNYDFDVSLNDDSKGFLGFEGKDLRIIGTAQRTDGGDPVNFIAPVEKLKLMAELIAEDNPEVIAINSQAQKPSLKDFHFELGDIESDTTDACKKELHEGLIDGVMQMYDSIWTGDMDALTNMPVESFIPMIAIRHLGGFAMEQSIGEKAIEFGFDPEMIFSSVRPTPKKKPGMLKAIESEFSQPADGEDPTMISLIMDENAINSFLLEFVLVERAVSMRDQMKVDPRLQEALAQMNTESLSVLLPQVAEEYGHRKPIDFYISLSHSLLSDKLDGVKPTGFQMDKNGNFRFIFNLSVTLLVQPQGPGGSWEEARSIYTSFTAKGKVTTNTSNKYGEKLLTILPKSAELSEIKIYNKENEEQELEQMLITSGFNMQMETAFRLVKPFEMPMKNIPTPPEVECLGIALSDLNLNFKKGYFEASCGYKKVDKPRDPEVCEGFLTALQEGPKKAQDSMNDLLQGKTPQEYIEEQGKRLDDELEKIKKQEQAKDSGSSSQKPEDVQGDEEKETIIQEEL